ncbi:MULTISPECIES: NAD-dependent epimerase/dehydratase family protein [unclassified Streptomyces]|uniref:NAD-dependent epimerase/dehydratase family protein n=1 Tax=unclassified Streptomyces TaxID=2593676 RepID=UPI0027E4834E|nr:MULTISPECIES: NAD-dependent epimerase/dehydratase family protein [unclassified Streptomyces]
MSSASVYDPRPGRALVTEDHPRGGHLNAYGRTKAAGKALALAAGAVVLRPRAVYGPGDTQLLPRLLSRVRAGTLLLPLAHTAARIAEALAAGDPALSRYAVDQLAHPVVLDLARARSQGGIPRRTLADYLKLRDQ